MWLFSKHIAATTAKVAKYFHINRTPQLLHTLTAKNQSFYFNSRCTRRGDDTYKKWKHNT
jgi:hypothetical protein